MNFDYIKEAEPSTDDLRQLYDSLYQNLEKAEELYWTKPQRCGMMLRKATEKICRIYNGYYEINFPESATLEEYLCYTGDDDHNAMVSRFLSVVRKEQRDRLEWLRVWGDECVFMEENPDQIRHNADKLYLNVKKMMVYMMEATKEMCTRIDHMENLQGRSFADDILPGYQSEEELEALEEQRQTIIQKYKQAENDFYSKTILAAEVKEEDFFCHVTHKTWDAILHDIRKAHEHDIDSTPDYSLAKKMALEIRKAIQSSGDYLGKVWAVIFNMLGIDFYKLPPDEQKILKRILSKSPNIKNSPFNFRRKRK